MLHHHGGVGTRRQHTAGGNAGALPALQRKRRRFPHAHVADDIELCRHRGTGAEGIRSHDGIAVHRGAVKGGHVPVRCQFFGQYATRRKAQVHRLCARHTVFHLFAHTGSRLRSCHHV